MYGLIGHPLSHSFSKGFFTDYFEKKNLSNCHYENFPMEDISNLRHFIKENKNIAGLNVTIPHKIEVLKYLDKIDEKAEKIGAVNTIRISRKDSGIFLEGFNTDETGFSLALKPLLRSNHYRALIFGNGGSAQTVKYVLKKLGITFLTVTRNAAKENEIDYKNLTSDHIRFFHLLINTTPLGMYPAIHDFPPIPYEAITSEHLLFDLIYNPGETVFLKKGKEKDALTSNGLTMLHQQALAAWGIWEGKN